MTSHEYSASFCLNTVNLLSHTLRETVFIKDFDDEMCHLNADDQNGAVASPSYSVFLHLEELNFQ